MKVTRDLIERMHAVGDIHDRRMAELAVDELDKLQATLARQSAALEKLQAFADDLLNASGWLEGDIDGGEFQDIAVKHGVLVEVKPTKPCAEEGCTCAEVYGDEEFAEGLVTCYRRNPVALAKLEES